MDANIDIGIGQLIISDLDNTIGLDMVRFNLTAEDIRLGRAGRGDGSLDLGIGDHTLTGTGTVIEGAITLVANNTLNFGLCDINSFGKIDGTNIANIVNDGAAIHGGSVGDLTITDNKLNAVNGVTDGTGNTDVAFEGDADFPSVGTLQMLGAGV